jgi:hypothetical protein
MPAEDAVGERVAGRVSELRVGELQRLTASVAASLLRMLTHADV